MYIIIHLSTRFRLVVKPNGTNVHSSLKRSYSQSAKVHKIVLKLNNILFLYLLLDKFTNINIQNLFTTIFAENIYKFLAKLKFVVELYL